MAELAGVTLTPDDRVSGGGGVELQQELVVLLLEQHDAVFEEQDVKVDRLEAAGVAQLQGQGAVIDQTVLGQVNALERRTWEKVSSCATSPCGPRW